MGKWIIKVMIWVLLASVLVVVVWFFQSKKVISQQNDLIATQSNTNENSVSLENANLTKILDTVKIEMWVEMKNINQLKGIKSKVDKELFEAETNYNLLLEAAKIIKKEPKESFWLN